MNIFKRTPLLALAIVFAFVALPVVAQEAPQGPQGSVTVGAQTGTGLDQSSKLQQYETVLKGVALFNTAFNWASASKYFIDFQGDKLGLDDQFASLQTGKKGAWAVNLQLNENPRWFSNTARTLYNESSPGVFVLPDGMRQNLQRIWSPSSTDPKAPADSNDNRFWSLRDYVNGSQPVDLRYLRTTGNMDLAYTALENWTFTGSYQRETRNGSEPLAFTAGPGIDEIANPVHYTTTDTRAEAEYAKGRIFANGAVMDSVFTNDVLYTTVDNPVRYNNTDYSWTTSPVTNTNANATARLWNAPDNKALSLDATGGVQLPYHNKATFTVTTVHMTMNEALIAQATNPNLGSTVTNFSLTPEYASVNGDMRQTVWALNFSGEPNPMYGYSIFYRSFNLSDNAPIYTFHSTVNSDGGASYSATGTSTGDASFDNGEVKVEGHVTPIHGLRLGVNFGHKKTNYADRDVLDVTNRTIGFTVDGTKDWAAFHGSYASLKQDPGADNPAAPVEGTTGGALDINAAMKDVAQQTGHTYNAAVTLTPVDKAAVTFSTQGFTADYPTTSIGLKKSTVKNFGVDFVYAFTPTFDVDGGYIYETYHMDTSLWYGANGTVSQPAATNTIDQYSNAIDDRVDTFHAGFKLDIVPGKLDVTSNYEYSKGRSDSGFTVVPGGQAGGDMLFPTNTTTVNFTQIQYLTYPEVFNATTIWKTFLNYHVHKNVTVSFLYWRQKYDQADWATDNLYLYLLPGSQLYASTPGSVTNLYPLLDPSANRALVLGATVPNYNANIFRVSLNYRF